MTPTCAKLKFQLDERRSWFSNEWFYKWHFIGRDGPVTIESFDGRGIHYGGIQFGGSARDVYWHAIVRGVTKEISDKFSWIDEEVRKYNRENALQAIDECAGQLMSFVRTIRREAVEKDRILRGDGVNFPHENDAGRWADTSDAVIVSRAEALKDALPLPDTNSAPVPQLHDQTRRQRATAIWNNNQWWLGPIALILSVAGIWASIR